MTKSKIDDDTLAEIIRDADEIAAAGLKREAATARSTASPICCLITRCGR